VAETLHLCVCLFSSSSSSNESAGSNSNEGLNDPAHVQRPSSSQLTPSIPSKSEQHQRVLLDDPDFDEDVELPPLEAVIPKDVLRKLKPKEKERQKVINGSLCHSICLVENDMVMGNAVIPR